MRRLTVFALLVYILIFWALVIFNGEVLLLLIPLILAAGLALLNAQSAPVLEVHRTFDTWRVSENAPVKVTLTVINRGAHLHMLVIKDAVPPALSVIDGNSTLITSLKSGASATLSYTVQGLRGDYQFGDVRLTTSDLTGMVRHEITAVTSGDRSFVTVPTASRLKRIELRPRQTYIYAGNIPARQGGPGTEFFGLRAYQTGDTLRHLNWRAMARHRNALYTNEFQQERIADVNLVVDVRLRSNPMQDARSIFDYSIRAAGSLAQALLHQGNRVSLLLYGYRVDWTASGFGKRQQERIFHSLAAAHLQSSEVFDTLRALPTRLFPPRSQIILVSPLVEDDSNHLMPLRAKGFDLLVISPDPLSFEMLNNPSGAEVEPAYRIARIEREMALNTARQAGVQVINWDVRQSFEHVMNSALSRPHPTMHRRFL